MSDRHHHDDDDMSEHERPLSGPALRAKALEPLLVEKGLADPKALDELIDTYEPRVGPRNGARIVARAWVDPAYKKRLLEDATAAIAEFGFIGRQGEDMVALENTPKVRNVVVCTLCSCYPWPEHSVHTTTLRTLGRSEEHTSELQSLAYLVCRLLLEKKK